MNESANPISGSVLIVDDDAFFRGALCDMLSELGTAPIHAAANGRDALRTLASLGQPVDYLVCDVFMPDMDGVEFLDRLATQGYAGRIVLVSGVDASMLGLSRTIAQANGLKITAALSKPVSLQQLATAMLG